MARVLTLTAASGRTALKPGYKSLLSALFRMYQRYLKKTGTIHQRNQMSCSGQRLKICDLSSEVFVDSHRVAR